MTFLSGAIAQGYILFIFCCSSLLHNDISERGECEYPKQEYEFVSLDLIVYLKIHVTNESIV